MKKTALFLLSLISAGWLLMEFTRKPRAAVDPGKVSTPRSHANPHAVSSPASAFVGDIQHPEKPDEALTEIENSWVKELRELRELAATDPDAALTRVAQMPDKHERKIAAEAVCLIAALKDPEKAMTAAWALDLGKFADEATDNTALENLAKQWAKVNLIEAFVWASALPADEEWRRDRVVKGIASALAQIAPAEAARMVAKHINSESSVQVEAAMEVLRQWALHDYAGAIAWAALFPEGAIRDRGIDELASIAPSPPPLDPPSN